MEPKNLDWYLDEAKRVGLYRSDGQLSKALGVTRATISAYRNRRQWPCDDAMIKIAEIAGLDPYKALMDLNAWRATTPAVRTAYRRLAELVGGTMAAVLIGAFLSSGAANAIGTDRAERYANRETASGPDSITYATIVFGVIRAEWP